MLLFLCSPVSLRCWLKLLWSCMLWSAKFFCSRLFIPYSNDIPYTDTCNFLPGTIHLLFTFQQRLLYYHVWMRFYYNYIDISLQYGCKACAVLRCVLASKDVRISFFVSLALHCLLNDTARHSPCIILGIKLYSYAYIVKLVFPITPHDTIRLTEFL